MRKEQRNPGSNRDLASHARTLVEATAAYQPLMLKQLSGDEHPLMGWAGVSWNDGSLRLLAASQVRGTPGRLGLVFSR